MRIIIARKTYPIGEPLTRFLPEDEIIPVDVSELPREALRGDVLVPAMTRIGRELIINSNWRLIQQFGVGLEGVDLEAAREAGIPVANVPSSAAPANAISTAEQALLLMLAVSRRLHEAQRALKQGTWGWIMGGRMLSGKQAAIVGLGEVGQALAKRLIALGLEVSGVKARPESGPAKELGLKNLVGPAGMAALLPSADFVISTVTANARTIHLFNREVFELMKPEAVFINVSRGAVVDEAALLEALQSGRLAGAGLDVFEREPLDPDHPLLHDDRVVAMPHTGGATRESFEQVIQAAAENINRLRQGRPILNRVV